MLTTTIALAEDHRNELLEEAKRHRLVRAAAGSRRRWDERRGGPVRDGRSERPSALVVAVVGLALAGGALVALLPGLNGGDITGVSQAPAFASDAELAEVETADLSYEPGHSSGWHVHPGVHSVVVLSGTLTVYDEVCGRQDYGPGKTYLGGRQPHLARNTGNEAIRLVVTYVRNASSDSPGTPVGAPAGCEAAA